MRVVDGILSPEECKKLISSAETDGFSRPEAFNESARSCERLHTVDVTLSDEIMKRIRPFLPEVISMDGARWKLNRFTHHWRYVKYRRGGHFIPHYDGSKLLPWHEMSVFTVQIYLNDDFTGGSTRFYTDFSPDRQASHQIDYGAVTEFNPPNPPTHSVIPRTGAALVFNHAGQSVLHDGADVEEGLKYILRGDILYTAFQDDIPILNNPSIPPHLRSWCPLTAEKFGTRTAVGQVWWCECAADGHGSDCCSLGLEQPLSELQSTPASASAARAAASLEEGRSKVEGSDDAGICGEAEAAGQQCGSQGEARLTERGAKASARGMEVILISGKRASGKDFVGSMVEAQLKALGVRAHRAALGAVNKRAYAAKAGVSLERLLHDRAFKEQHRVTMVAHHTARNRADPEWCLKQVVASAEEAGAQVLVLTDLRTRQDLAWFEARAKAQGRELVLLRVEASDAARAARGWDKHEVKDALVTEVDLDSFVGWTAQLDNSAHKPCDAPEGEGGEGLVTEWVRNTVLPRVAAARETGWRGAA